MINLYAANILNFILTGALEGLLMKSTNTLISLSEENLMDCSSDRTSCSGGNMINAFKYVLNNGINTQDSYPYKGVVSYSIIVI